MTSPDVYNTFSGLILLIIVGFFWRWEQSKTFEELLVNMLFIKIKNLFAHKSFWMISNV